VINHDELTNSLELVEHLLKPLEIYAKIPYMPTMDKMIFNIIVELLSILTLTTKDLEQG
jgi:hypothetical protein